MAYEQIADHRDGGSLPHCTNAGLPSVEGVSFGGIESALTGQRVVLPNLQRAQWIGANG